MKQRLDYIDRTRGILIILVVIGHIWQDGYLHNFIYNFHMPAFFAISGMLLCYTQSYKKNFLSFARSRIYSFGIPFIFIEILGSLTNIIRHGASLNIKGYLYNTLTLNFNDPNLWFLFSLFWIEILFVLFKKALKKDMLVFAVAVVLLGAALLIPRSSSYFVSAGQICHYFIYFAVGFCFTDLLSKLNKPAVAISWAAVLAAAAVFGKRNDPGLTLENIVFLISAVLGTYAVLQTGKIKLPEKLDRWMVCAGKNTITIYGTHHIYYSIVGALLGITDYNSTPLWAGLVMLAAVIILEIPTVYVINRWLPFLAGKHYKRKEKAK